MKEKQEQLVKVCPLFSNVYCFSLWKTFLTENTSAKWFCGFTLNAHTPEHTLFTKVRKRIGTKRLSKIFNLARKQMKKQGFMSEVFTFVDATHLISKANLWEERDKLIENENRKTESFNSCSGCRR